MKWLQSLTAIIIDPERAPYAATEFLEYEYEQDPDGNFISEYPDKNNHSSIGLGTRRTISGSGADNRKDKRT